MLNEVKVDKLSFGLDSVSPDIKKKIDEVIDKYYGVIIMPKNSGEFNNMKRDVTPTKQLREGYDGYNHNLQMILLGQFCQFLKELRSVAEQDLSVYEMHLAVDTFLNDKVVNYLDTLYNHEYLNGYVSSKKGTCPFYTIYIAKKKKNFKSNGKQKLRIKFYDKAEELMSRNSANRILPLKEPVNIPELPMAYATGGGRYGILLYKINLLRCEMELREDNLPYRTIDQIIEAIEGGSFQDELERIYDEILSKTVFAEPTKKTSCSTLKEIAINDMRNSTRNYKLLSNIHNLNRAYNYFKKAKEVVTRENDLNFEELRAKLTSTPKAAPELISDEKLPLLV